MKQACYTMNQAKENAIKEMENCMAYLTIGNKRKAAVSYGSALVYDEMLSDVFDIYLEETDEHYHDMCEIWYETVRQWE